MFTRIEFLTTERGGAESLDEFKVWILDEEVDKEEDEDNVVGKVSKSSSSSGELFNAIFLAKLFTFFKIHEN